jgi:hypothetical protein
MKYGDLFLFYISALLCIFCSFCEVFSVHFLLQIAVMWVTDAHKVITVSINVISVLGFAGTDTTVTSWVLLWSFLCYLIDLCIPFSCISSSFLCLLYNLHSCVHFHFLHFSAFSSCIWNLVVIFFFIIRHITVFWLEFLDSMVYWMIVGICCWTGSAVPSGGWKQ